MVLRQWPIPLAVALTFAFTVVPTTAQGQAPEDDGWLAQEPAPADDPPAPAPNGDAPAVTPQAPAGEPSVPADGDGADSQSADSQSAGAVTVITVSTRPPPSDAGDDDADEPAHAAPTLLGRHGPMAFGAYAGVDVRYTRVAGHDGLLVGGETALLIDHRLSMGGAGYGLANLVRGPRTALGDPTYVGFGYGGLSLRANFVGESPVYLSAGVLVGAGGLGFAQQTADYELELAAGSMDASAFFIVEPSIGLHANVTRWLRLGAVASYRATRGIAAEGYDDGDFSGLAAGGQLEFGWF